MRKYILAINPGSTSTKVAIFEGSECRFQKNLSHSKDELKNFGKISEQFDFRKTVIEEWLKEINVKLPQIIAVVGRGGLLRAIPSGTYYVTQSMKNDLTAGARGEHASNLGGLIAAAIAEEEGINAYIVDPVAVDEFEDVARVSGMPELPRLSLVHALNIRAVALYVCTQMNKRLEDVNLIVAHLGGGITISPIRNGKIIDANNANEAGPFSPERCGSVPIGSLVEMAFSGKYTKEELKNKMLVHGGLFGYLGTNDAREVQKRIDTNDEYAKFIFDAMGYQISKEIGACAAVLCGKVDCIIITGGLAYSDYLMNYVKDRVDFIAPVVIYPGEDEMRALAEGALRVINNVDKAKIYEDEVIE